MSIAELTGIDVPTGLLIGGEWSKGSATFPVLDPATEQPAASAGPILRVAIAAGKFHGVISRLTPIGWCKVMILFAPDGARMRVPSRRTASSAYQRKNSAA